MAAVTHECTHMKNLIFWVFIIKFCIWFSTIITNALIYQINDVPMRYPIREKAKILKKSYFCLLGPRKRQKWLKWHNVVNFWDKMFIFGVYMRCYSIYIVWKFRDDNFISLGFIGIYVKWTSILLGEGVRLGASHA